MIKNTTYTINKKPLLYIFILSVALLYITNLTNIYSQNNNIIVGFVTDIETKEPLAFTNIIYKTTNSGTVSNTEGVFNINTNGLTNKDTILFSYIGYNELQITVENLINNPTVNMQKTSLSLNEVGIYSNTLSAKEVIKKVKEQWSNNYKQPESYTKFYYHSNLKVGFYDSKVSLEKSSIDIINSEYVNEINKIFSDTINSYSDIIGIIDTKSDSSRLFPIKAITLSDASNTSNLLNESNKKIDDILKKDLNNDNTYWKLKSGVFAGKVDFENNDTIVNDPNFRKATTKSTKNKITSFTNSNSKLAETEWEFLDSPRKYKFEFKNSTVVNGEKCYTIKFKPKQKGIFEGELIISMSDFGIYRAYFAYAEGKTNTDINILKVSFSENLKHCYAIFSKTEKGYQPKYIFSEDGISFKLNRKISLLQKQKKFLKDRTLEEIDGHMYICADAINTEEYLFISDNEEENKKYINNNPPKFVNYKRIKEYSSDIWGEHSFIMPKKEIIEYKKKY